MDCGWTDRRLACWTSDEGWRHDRLHHRGIRWCGDFGRDYPLTEKSLIVEISSAYCHAVEARTSPCPCSQINVVGVVLRAVLLAHNDRRGTHTRTTYFRNPGTIRGARLRGICSTELGEWG